MKSIFSQKLPVPYTMQNKSSVSRRRFLRLSLLSLSTGLVTAKPQVTSAQLTHQNVLSTGDSGKPVSGMVSQKTLLSSKPLFESFFLGGFECSTHRLHSGKRLDLIAATAHDRYVAADYRRLQKQGIRTIREGIRWHLIEQTPGQYDFSSVLPILHTARNMNMQVIWDLCHFGWPDDLDIFSSEFVQRFAHLSRAFTQVLSQETDTIPLIAPINEISYLSWAGGDVAHYNPFTLGRGEELKKQLVRATIAATEAIWEINPRVRIAHIDPVINIIADPTRPQDYSIAEDHRLVQYQAWDMLAGRTHPELGGKEKYLDIIGVNYYDHNQWIYNGRRLIYTDGLYRPFRQILREVYERYGRPVFVSETGTEGEARVSWFHYMCGEVSAAIQAGVPIKGMCLYPIVNFPDWDDERHCYNGLWDYPNTQGERELYQPLADELHQQQYRIEQVINVYYQRLV